jgi:hypothetical protein
MCIFSNHFLVLRHVRVIHGRQTCIQCPFCSTIESTLITLKTHVSCVHHVDGVPEERRLFFVDFIKVLDTVIEFKKRPRVVKS